MAQFPSQDKAGRELYRHMIGCIVPRPIAWVATRGKAGNANLAPFSFFNGITWNPPALAFSCTDRGGGMKDTSRNIVHEHAEFIVHIVSEALAEQMNVTCGEYGAHVDEFVEAGLTAVRGTAVDVPRVAEAPVALECRLLHHVRLGEGHPEFPACSHIIGEIVHWHIDDRVLTGDTRAPIDPDALLAVGRMGELNYTRTRDRFRLVRPQVPPEDPRSLDSFRARGATRESSGD